jgi:hypothetical protein
MDLMQAVTRQARRILKPRGSALFIVQPNSATVGSMRLWVWDFLSWVGREWNIVQDAYWWNITAPPTTHTHRTRGLMRPSVKYCIWIGAADCYRNQDAVLWQESLRNITQRNAARINGNELKRKPSGWTSRDNRAAQAAADRGGVTPFNLLPIPTGDTHSSSSAYGHGAGTPAPLASWWQRYLTPPRGVTCDPFMGAGTMGETAINNGFNFIGIEEQLTYFNISQRRIALAQPALL